LKQSCSSSQSLSNHIYFQFLEQGKAPFGSVKIWRILNPFEPFGIFFLFSLNQIKTKPGGTVLPGLLVSAPRRTAPLSLTPSCTQPLPTGPRYHRSRLSAAYARIARTPPLAPIEQQWRRPRSLAGG
jgi:hypothetical protein